MADKVDIWMPLFIGDYLSSTMHLTPEQHGAYLLIQMSYWKNLGPLPESVIPTITRLSPDAWSIAQALFKQFFDTESKPGFWVHADLDAKLKKAAQNKKTNEERAKAAADKRWKLQAEKEKARKEAEPITSCPTPPVPLYRDPVTGEVGPF